MLLKEYNKSRIDYGFASGRHAPNSNSRSGPGTNQCRTSREFLKNIIDHGSNL
jgi:hypothetical protein